MTKKGIRRKHTAEFKSKVALEVWITCNSK